MSEKEVITGNDVIFSLFSFLPADPTSFPWCSVEQEINWLGLNTRVLCQRYGSTVKCTNKTKFNIIQLV